MGDKIKSAFEIAMERAAKIGELSPEEKEKIEIKKIIEPILSDFYKKKINPEKLWEKLKGNKTYVLVEAQLELIGTLSFSHEMSDIKRRKDAILAIESLKEEPKTSTIEQYLNTILNLKERSEQEKKEVYNNFKMQIERDPKLRLREINQGDAKMVVRLSVEDAINQNPQWKKFVYSHESQYNQQFSKIIKLLKEEISKSNS